MNAPGVTSAAPLWNSLALDRALATPLQRQLVEFFRAAILSGRLRPGERLPSSRALATEQNVARVTVLQAYESLIAEGYLIARSGAGVFVAAGVPDQHLRATPQPASQPPPEPPPPTGWSRPLPLSPGLPSLEQFPWDDWARISARVHRERNADWLSYHDPQGLADLRQAIARHLTLTRGIDADPERLIIVGGSQQGIDLMARVLGRPGDQVWVEDPGYVTGRRAVQSAGLEIVPVPVDAEGMDVAAGQRLAPHAKLALVSPSHQYPLGMALSLRRRMALLDWAEAAGGWVLEDDYNGEFRYAGRPITPLCMLSRTGRVAYLGTFSKILAPSLRLGYLLLPEALVPRFLTAKAASDRGAPALLQVVLARFIAEGRLNPHLRRMRVLYAERRRRMLTALASHAADVLTPDAAPDAGMHLVAELIPDVPDHEIARRAAAEFDLGPAALSGFYARAPRRNGLALGFAGIPEAAITPAIKRLAGIIRRMA